MSWTTAYICTHAPGTRPASRPPTPVAESSMSRQSMWTGLYSVRSHLSRLPLVAIHVAWTAMQCALGAGMGHLVHIDCHGVYRFRVSGFLDS